MITSTTVSSHDNVMISHVMYLLGEVFRLGEAAYKQSLTLHEQALVIRKNNLPVNDTSSHHWIGDSIFALGWLILQYLSSYVSVYRCSRVSMMCLYACRRVVLF